MMTKLLFFLLSIFLLGSGSLFSQSYTVPFTGTDTITSCGGAVFDHGQTLNYSNSANGTLTILPGTSGSYVMLTFSSFQLETCCDRLYIYNGTTTSAPLLGTYSTSPGVIYASNVSGALTLKFTTDGSGTYSGFEAAITCIPSVPLSDLMHWSASVSNPQNVAGGTVNLTYTVKNIGSISSSSSTNGFYLSTDDTWDISDVYLSNQVVGILASGNTQTLSKSVVIPSLTALGNYFIVFRNDDANVVNESDETNNVTAVPVSISTDIVDPCETILSLSATTVVAGKSVTASGTIYNLGNASVPTTSLSFYLSNDLIVDGSDVQLLSSTLGTIAAGSSISFSQSLLIPSGTSYGKYNILVFVDDLNSVAETGEHNNVYAVNIDITESSIDLSVLFQSLSVRSVIPGASLSVSPKISNQSNQSVNLSIAYFLSLDSLFDLSDTYLNSINSNLSPNAINWLNSSILIPSNTPSGTYYIITYLDYIGAFSESNEQNNFFPSPISIIAPDADLVVLSPLASPIIGFSGSNINLTCSIHNSGSTASTSSHIAYYFSPDSLFDINDVYLNSIQGSSLSAGASFLRSTNITIPVGTSAGDYYIIFFADYSNAEPESNEGNNFKTQRIKVITAQSDLMIQTPSISVSNPIPGSSFTIYNSMTNLGIGSASSSNTSYYLSSDLLIDAGDVLLGTWSGGNLNGGSNTSQNRSVLVPLGTLPGNYYLLFEADPGNLIAESDETNNVLSMPLSLEASYIDLKVINPTCNLTKVAQGASISVSYTALNAGTSASSSSNSGYYLSNDPIFDAGDVLLSTANGGSINAGGTSNKAATLTIPSSTAIGNYYILMYVDYNVLELEPNELNNVRSIPIAVEAPSIDFSIVSPSLGLTTLGSGTSVSSAFYILNTGNTASTSSNVGFYLSTDNVFDASDVSLGIHIGGITNRNSVSQRTDIFTIPSGTIPGTYYVLFKADYSGLESETNEANNVNSVQIKVLAPSFDLTVYNPSFNYSSVVPGGTYYPSCRAKNKGTIATSSCFVGYYLSTNAVLDPSDVFLTFTNLSALNSGYSTNQYPSINIPLTTTRGNYYILYVVDYTGIISESDESNNLTKTPIFVETAGAVVNTMPLSGSTSITTCSGTICDDGGTGNYSSNANGSLTINPGTAGSYISLFFNSFSIQTCCDNFSIFDGTSTSAPLIGTFTSNPGMIKAKNASGALTLKFVSDASTSYSGFQAQISCEPTLHLPDLTILTGTSLNTATIGAGGTISSSIDVLNQGENLATNWNVGYYLSSDTIKDASDTYLTNFPATSQVFTVDYSTTLSKSITIPSNTPLGAYYLLTEIDYTNLETESIETNNLRWNALNVVASSIDFVVSKPILITPLVTSGSTVNNWISIMNQGSMASMSGGIGYYLSSDTIKDAGDTYLTYSSLSSLQSGSFYASNYSFTMPLTTPSGTYYLIYYADYSNTSSESNETNNTSWAAITVVNNQPDLEIIKPFLSTGTVFPNQSLNMSCQVYNSSDGYASSSSVGFYLSSDTLFDGSDVYLNYNYGYGINAGITSYRSASATISGTTLPGNYYILYKADYNSSTVESNENNNVAWMPLSVLAPTIDLKVNTPCLSVSSFVKQTSVSASVYIKNNGLSASNASDVGCYISSDTLFDASDTYLNYASGSGLAAGGSSLKSTSFLTSASTTPGNYYILFYADYANAVQETNETNNIAWQAITILPSTVDFVIASPQLSLDEIAPGSSISVSSSLLNKGNSTAATSSTGYYLSTNNSWDASDVYLASFSNPTILSESSAIQSATLTVPLATVPGNYFIILHADYSNAVSEINEANNFSSAPFKVVVNFVDLSILNPYLNSNSVVKGNSVNVNTNLLNRGNSNAAASYIGYYLSTDSLWSAGDVSLGLSNAILLNGSSYTGSSQTLIIPINTVPGNYYILFRADNTLLISESNESNNVSFSKIKVTNPDIDLSTLAPVTNNLPILAGTIISVRFELLNTGEIMSPPSCIGFFLSTDSLYSPSDIALVSPCVNTLNPHTYGQQTFSTTIPLGTAAGIYYLLIYTDFTNLVTETNEGNNINYYKIKIEGSGVDLTSVNHTLSSPSALAGSTLMASTYVFNQGNSSASSSDVGYYLSTDTLWSGSDVSLGLVPGGVLAFFTSNLNSTSLLIPSNTVSGNYYIIYVADPTGIQSESSETNNVSFLPITIGLPFIDLQLLNAALSNDSIAAGSATNASCEVINGGTAGSASSDVACYLSTDAVWDPSDVYLNNAAGGSLLPNATSSHAFLLTIPALTPAGMYYLIYFADYLNVESENTDTNNYAAIPITIFVNQADLVIQNAALDVATVWSGLSVTATGSIYNQGLASASSSNIGYYLSGDTIWDPSDTYLNSNSGGVLAVNTTSPLSNSLVIPSSVLTGSYFILFVADYSLLLSESSETNNVSSVQINVIQANVDLSISSTNSSTDTTTVGSVLSVSCTVLNSGSIASGSNNLAYYLSLDTIWDPSDVYLTSTTGGNLSSGATNAHVGSVTIPAVANGNYYILYFVDYLNAETESSENNNLAFELLTIVAGQPDLVVQNPSLNASTVWSGSSVLATGSILNQGNLSATSSNVGYYLSTDQIWDGSDIQLNVSVGGNLAANVSSALSSSLLIPVATSSGSYYILFVADNVALVSESLESNNLSFVPIVINQAYIDLLLTGVTASTGATTAGGTLTVTTDISNAGSVASNSSNLGHYLSSDVIWDPSDVYLNGYNGGVLSAGTTITDANSLTIPALTTPGNYHILYFVDHLNAETESSETNNVLSLPLTIILNQADLVIQNPTLSAAIVFAGLSLTANSSILNQGTEIASSSNVGYYLSSDQLWDAADVYLSVSNGGTLLPNSSNANSIPLTIPSNTIPGDYYVLFYADHASLVLESIETNNVSFVPITISQAYIDLAIAQATASEDTAAVGGLVSLSCEVSNLGNVSSSTSNVGYYLSQDPVWDPADVFLNTTNGADLNPGATNNHLTQVTIPPLTAPGDYYLLYFSDFLNAEIESTDTNNVTYKAITIIDSINFLQELNEASGLSVFPNPANESIQISSIDFAVNHLELLDATGKLIYYENQSSQGMPSSNIDLNLSSYPSGSYVLKIRTENAVFVTKILIQH